MRDSVVGAGGCVVCTLTLSLEVLAWDAAELYGEPGRFRGFRHDRIDWRSDVRTVRAGSHVYP